MAEKYSVHRFTGDGVKTDWEFNFTGGYIAQSDVKASVRSATNLETAVGFDWVGPNTIRITPAVGYGLRLTIYRDTPKNLPLVDFVDGAIINERNLDKIARQAVFVAAEMVDAFGDVTIDSQAAIITANQALITAGQATSTANSALLAASGAVTTANAARSTANAANDKADQAVQTANSANATAIAADGKATAANTKADQANATAGQANTAAQNAAQTAATANVNSSGAVTTANDARGRAITAQEVAGNAVTVAQGASATATAVRGEFDDLRDTVEEIAGADLSSFVKTDQTNEFSQLQRFTAGVSIGGVQWGGSGVNAKIINAWGDITGKPSTFPSTWGEVGGKPTTFPPSGHTHGITDIVNLHEQLNRRLLVDYTGMQGLAGPIAIGTDDANRVQIERGWLEVRNNTNNYGPYIDLSINGSVDYSGRVAYTGNALKLMSAGTNGIDLVADNPAGHIAAYSNSGKQSGHVLTEGGVTEVIVTGIKAFRSSSDPHIAGAGAALEVRGGDNPGVGAWMKFHRPNQYGTYFGMFGDGRWGFGGWSAGNNIYEFWTNKNLPNPVSSRGVNGSDGNTYPIALGWTPAGTGRLVAEINGGSYVSARRGHDEEFRDVHCLRGDGTGAVFLGGGAYLHHDGSGYDFGGGKAVRINNDLNIYNGNMNLQTTGKRFHIEGYRQPKFYVEGNGPSDQPGATDRDVWIQV